MHLQVSVLLFNKWFKGRSCTASSWQPKRNGFCSCLWSIHVEWGWCREEGGTTENNRIHWGFSFRRLCHLLALFIGRLQLNLYVQNEWLKYIWNKYWTKTWASACCRCLLSSIFLNSLSFLKRSYFLRCSSILRALGSTCTFLSICINDNLLSHKIETKLDARIGLSTL